MIEGKIISVADRRVLKEIWISQSENRKVQRYKRKCHVTNHLQDQLGLLDSWLSGWCGVSITVDPTEDVSVNRDWWKLINLLDSHNLQLICPVYYQWANTEEERNTSLFVNKELSDCSMRSAVCHKQLLIANFINKVHIGCSLCQN